MKIQANREDLLKPLLMAGSVVERRQTLPILANVLLSGESGQLKVTATDLEVEITASALAVMDDAFQITLPARKFIDICKALPDGAALSIDIENDKATVRSGRGRYVMGTLPARDYPNIEATAGSHVFQLPMTVFKRLLEKTAFAMAQQDVRYYLNGMLLEIRADRIRTVATDGHRLALAEATLDVGEDLDFQVILPRKAVIELAKMLEDKDEELRVELSNSHVCFSTSHFRFTSKLVDGRFPDYERVMPQGESHFLQADKALLKQALTRTSILSNEKYRGIHFQISGSTLHLQAHNPEQDEATEELEVDYSGPDISIGFNVSYLLDVINVIDTDTIVLALVDSNSSAMITPHGSTECRYIVMPMRL